MNKEQSSQNVKYFSMFTGVQADKDYWSVEE